MNRNGWTLSMVNLLAPPNEPDPGVQATISGSGSEARISACSGRYKEIDLDRAGESAQWVCDSSGTLSVVALNASPTIKIVKRICKFSCWNTQSFLSTGQRMSTGSPFTADAGNTGSILVELLDKNDLPSQ